MSASFAAATSLVLCDCYLTKRTTEDAANTEGMGKEPPPLSIFRAVPRRGAVSIGILKYGSGAADAL
jgi:hypothetical protein